MWITKDLMHRRVPLKWCLFANCNLSYSLLSKGNIASPRWNSETVVLKLWTHVCSWIHWKYCPFNGWISIVKTNYLWNKIWSRYYSLILGRPTGGHCQFWQAWGRDAQYLLGFLKSFDKTLFKKNNNNNKKKELKFAMCSFMKTHTYLCTHENTHSPTTQSSCPKWILVHLKCINFSSSMLCFVIEWLAHKDLY